MGFLSDILNNGVVREAEQQYTNMNLSELTSKWNSVFGSKKFPSGDKSDIERVCPEHSVYGVLDRIYAKRTGKKSWKQKALEYQKKQRQAYEREERIRQQKEEKKKQEAARRAEQEKAAASADQEAQAFKSRLRDNELAKEIIAKIDSLGKNAQYIGVFPHKVIIEEESDFLDAFFDDNVSGFEEEDSYVEYELDAYEHLSEFTYEDFGYPLLNPNEVQGLIRYIQEMANGKYEYKKNKRYKHRDYPGHLELVKKKSVSAKSW